MLPRSLFLLFRLAGRGLDELYTSLGVGQLAFLLSDGPLELLYFQLAAEQSTLQVKQSHLLLSWGSLGALKKSKNRDHREGKHQAAEKTNDIGTSFMASACVTIPPHTHTHT